MQLSSTRPYLLRALYEWILDNDLTPYLLVNAGESGVVVPTQWISEEGKIVLNIAPSAVQDLLLETEAVRFKARFQGTPLDVHVPVAAVEAIYAKENGKGMIFSNDEEATDQPPDPPGSSRPGKPQLRLVT